MSVFFRSSFWVCLFVALLAWKCYGELKVAVIDTGLNLGDARFAPHLCPTGHQDFTGTGLLDLDGHGTHIVGLITKNASVPSGYCIVILKYFSDQLSSKATQEAFVSALQEAVRQGVNIINMSGGGLELDERELLIMERAGAKTLLIGAAGNEGEKRRAYPGCMGLANTRCVGALDEDYKRASFSNYGPWVDVWQPGVNILSTLPHDRMGYMSGTSMSTAIETGKEINRRLNAVHQTK